MLTVVVVAAAAAGCNDDGRTLAPAPPVPISPETTTTTQAVGQALGLTLRSPAFEDGAALDASFTCDGVNVPPPLEVVGVPEAAAELAVVMTDLDAGGEVHWVLTGLPATVTRIESGLIPPEARAAVTDSGVEGWDGPCPPADDGPHTYEFVVHALPEPIGLAPGTPGRDAIGLIEQSSLGRAALVTTYQRTG